MARGTGLPSPDNDVLARAASVQSGDRFSSAAAWSNIARSGARVKNQALAEFEQANRQAQAAYLAEEEVEITKKRAELRNKHAFSPKAFETEWQAYTEGKLGNVEPWAVDHLKVRLARQGTSAFNSILGERRRRDLSNNRRSMRARIETAELDAIEAMVEGSPEEAEAALTEYRAVQEAGVSNGLVTQAEANLSVKKLRYKAKSELRRRDTETADLVKDDIESVRQTGQGVEVDQDRARTVLGPKRYDKYLEDREDAKATYEATEDLGTLTSEEIVERLNDVKPQAGSEGFARQQKVFEEVRREAVKHIKARIQDPAAAVSGDAQVRAARDAVVRGDEGALERLAGETVRAQQSIGIPEANIRIFSKTEAKERVAQIETAPPEEAAARFIRLSREFGDQWPRAYQELVENGLSGSFSLLGVVGDSGTDVEAVSVIANLKESEMRANSGTEERKRENEMLIQLEEDLVPFFNVLEFGTTRTGQADSYLGAMRKVALLQYQRNGGDDRAAREFAVNLFEKRFEPIINSNQRIMLPRSTGLSSGEVASAAELAQARARLEAFGPVLSDPTRSDLLNESAALENAVRQGVWGTNEDGTGMILYHQFPGGGVLPVRNEAGERYEVKFDDVRNLLKEQSVTTGFAQRDRQRRRRAGTELPAPQPDLFGG